MAEQEFLELFWKSVDLFYDNNHKEGIGVRELLEIFIKYQEWLKNKKVEFYNMPPYAFQLISSFKKAVLDENKFQVMVNWHNKIRVGVEFDIKSLDVLVNTKYVIFQDGKKYMGEKIIISLFK